MGARAIIRRAPTTASTCTRALPHRYLRRGGHLDRRSAGPSGTACQRSPRRDRTSRGSRTLSGVATVAVAKIGDVMNIAKEIRRGH